MPINRRKTIIPIVIFYTILFFGILILDQISKSLVELKLQSGESIPLIKNVLHVTFVCNTGAAFGLFKGGFLFFIFISIIAVFIILFVIINSFRKPVYRGMFLFNLCLVFIMSGTVGNLIDRFRLGYVVDFIDIRIWPVFNFADTFISIGSCILLYNIVRKNTG
jgi:signal peptidase II